MTKNDLKAMSPMERRFFFCITLVTALALSPSRSFFVAGHEGHSREGFQITRDIFKTCKDVIYDFNPHIHKALYRVGVYTSEGDEVAHKKYDDVFENYLSATAGQKFNPPIRFELVPVTLASMVEMTRNGTVDFMYSSAAAFSCMATEFKAQALATVINHRESRGHYYDLDVYGGVMFTLASNTDIKSIEDFRGRIIGAGAITSMGGGQTQFYEMVKAGLSWVSDPKQVIFTGDERHVVQGLLDGDFDVGFARTDQIERHLDKNGQHLHQDTFKIINPQTHILEDGKIFPFVSSTGLHPEWPVAALDHVDRGLAKEVQEALLDLGDHCKSLELNETLLCDTTPELAQLAKKASISGGFIGFRTPRSYFEVRTKQEKAGIFKDIMATGGSMECIRGDTLYQDLQCPHQYYKVTEEQFHKSCEAAGLECKEGYECYCQPCAKHFEVDIYQYNEQGVRKNKDGLFLTEQVYTSNATAMDQGCPKMALCGVGEQTKDIIFRAYDNLYRENGKVKVILHLSDRDVVLKVQNVPGANFTYEFKYAGPRLGIGVMEVFFDGEQIPESPLRLQVVERTCEVDYGAEGREPDSEGNCICRAWTVEINGKCISVTIFAVIGAVAGIILLLVAISYYIKYKNRKSDELWTIHVDELQFDEPAEVIGQGSFGVVLLAEYRGTKVAVKRALKERKKGGSSNRSITSLRRKRQTLLSSDDAGKIPKNVETSFIKEGEDSEETPPESTCDLEAAPELLREETITAGTNSNEQVPGSQYHFDVGFIRKDLGPKKSMSRSIIMCNTNKRETFKNFHGSLLLGSLSESRETEWCPWFTDKARRQEEFKNEMRVLSRLRHPCITTVMGAVIAGRSDPFLVMEFMENGSLADLLRNETVYLSGDIILQITRNLAQGLRFLHSSRPPILHGDLKAKNILVDSRFRAKLCDFGLSTKTSNSVSGTPYWLAPEYLTGHRRYDTSCDIYSVGIILYEIFSRKSPYEGQDYKEVIRGVCNRRINKRPDIPATTPPRYLDLMKKCWSADPENRPQARSLDLTLMDLTEDDAEPLREEDQANKKRAGDLLYDIFPKHVADALKQGKKVEPEKHEMVTVIFSDIVKFTDISRQIGPEKVCDMLDRLYVAFDACARKHSVFKVETIGDSWMGVTNLERNQNTTHVKNMAEFAMEMVKVASTILVDLEDPCRGYVTIRVGFNSGSVVSNVIGSVNKRYCLFGDTVNTASRMETNSIAGRILCSERSYQLLKEQAPGIKTKEGGKINVKGKGDMYVYWVGKKAKSPRRATHQLKTVGFAMNEMSESHDHTEWSRTNNPLDRSMDQSTGMVGNGGDSSQPLTEIKEDSEKSYPSSQQFLADIQEDHSEQGQENFA